MGFTIKTFLFHTSHDCIKQYGQILDSTDEGCTGIAFVRCVKPAQVSSTSRIFSLFFLFLTLILTSALSAHAGFFDDFSIKDEAELGRKFDIMVRSQMPIIEDPEIKQYVRSIVARLEEHIPPQPFPFKTDVILHNSINAFAVPGGFVFVHTGLIMNLEHESELAGVIAHELAHVTQRHVANRIDRSKYTTLASMLGVLAGAFLGGKGNGDASGALFAGAMAASQTAALNYSRIDEAEADHTGLQYLIRAGYRPIGMSGAFEKIRKRQWTSGLVVPEYLSTHPDIQNRINDISNRVSLLPESIRNTKDDDTLFIRVKSLLLARYGDIETSKNIFSKMGNSNGIGLMGRAMLAERQHRIKEAENLFGQAVKASPRDSLIRREAGIFFYKIGDKRASVFLNNALRIDPKDSMAQYYKARLLDDSEKHYEAQELFRHLLKSYPDDAELHQLLGTSLGKSKAVCEGWLHLAYAALYRGQHAKLQQFLTRAKKEAHSERERQLIKKFEQHLKERKDYQDRN